MSRSIGRTGVLRRRASAEWFLYKPGAFRSACVPRSFFFGEPQHVNELVFRKGVPLRQGIADVTFAWSSSQVFAEAVVEAALLAATRE